MTERKDMEDIILEKKYSIPYDMFGDAFSAFQKRFVYPRNMIMAAILLIAAGFNIVTIAKGNGTLLGYALVFACLGLAVINFYNPKKIKRNLMKSIKGIEGDVYRLKLMPDKLVIGTVLEPLPEEEKTKEEYEEVFEDVEPEEISDSEIYLTKSVVVMDKPEFFMVYLKRAMFYVIPKKEFSEEEVTIMQIHFQKQLDKNYRKYDK